MKNFLYFMVLSFGFLQAQHHTVTSDKPATHGMSIMGTSTVYASHLPMFHSPHDYQIILELEFDTTTKKRYTDDQKNNPLYTIYTIEPEKFILPDMMNHPKPFQANLYRGHFERGGIKIASDITITIKKVVYFAKIDPKAIPNTTSDYIVFGNEKEQFLSHKITSRPDFDQIIQISPSIQWSHINNLNYELLHFSTEKKPLGVSSNTIEVQLDQKTISLTLLRQLYLEFEDLK